eukprot:11214410-Lingulodinium_polyedra.AAC.1
MRGRVPGPHFNLAGREGAVRLRAGIPVPPARRGAAQEQNIVREWPRENMFHMIAHIGQFVPSRGRSRVV